MANRLGHAALIVALCAVATASRSQTPSYAISLHAIGGGTHTVGNGCYRLAGTLGEAAPGYSSSAGYALLAGFRAGAPGAVDAIFISGFEEC